MSEINTKIEEIQKQLRLSKYNLYKLKETQLEFAEELKSNPLYVEASKYINGEYQVPNYRWLLPNDYQTMSQEEIAKFPKDKDGRPMKQDGYTKTDINWLIKNNPELYRKYASLDITRFSKQISGLELQISQLEQQLEELYKQREIAKKQYVENLLGVQITNQHDIQMIDENGQAHISFKSEQELNKEEGFIKIKLNEMEMKGQIDEDLKEEILDYIDSVYSGYRLTNRNFNEISNNQIYQELFQEQEFEESKGRSK